MDEAEIERRYQRARELEAAGARSRREAERETGESLEPLLEALTRYGRPSLSMHDDGWHCRVKMHTAAAGAEFTVKSDFRHPTPCAAASECANRVREALGEQQEALDAE